MSWKSADSCGSENYWILVTKEFTDFNRGSLDDIIKKVKREKRWPIGRGTRNRYRVKSGDLVLLYLSGNNNEKFFANAILSTKLQMDKSEIFDHVGFGEVEVWEKYIKIEPMINELDFIKNKQKWWGHLRGGIIRISKSDFYKIFLKSGYQGKTGK